MLHHGLLPSRKGLRQWVAALVLAAMPGLATAQQSTGQPASIVSLNMCTDQLLLDLAPRNQILGLSPFAADAARSWFATEARQLPILSGTAEEVMVLKPDLVVSGTFTKRATREFIKARGMRMEEFPPVRSIAETKRQIARFGELTGAKEKAAARIAAIDAALANLKAAASARTIRVLPLSRRAWVTGAQSLTTDLLTQAGFVNVASEMGLTSGGRVSLETIVLLKPDALLLSSSSDSAEDQGKALLLHPAIQSLFPQERRMVIPERLTVCGGPMLAEAMQALADQINRLSPR
ncbi:MAG: ABC transporter substrate-binding protein [Beijerinckiaceae bacterium]